MPKETFINLKQEKQERILRSAIAEFNACGFIKANVGTIAKNAGVAKGSIYQYFEDKNELFVHCVTWSVEMLLHLAGGNRPVADIDIFEYASFDIKQRIDLMRREKEISVFAQEVFMGKFSSAPHETTDEMMRVSEDYVLELIRAGQKMGTVRTDMDDEILALFLTGATTKVKEHIMKTTLITDFAVTDDQALQLNRKFENLMTLLKDSIGAKEA